MNLFKKISGFIKSLFMSKRTTLQDMQSLCNLDQEDLASRLSIDARAKEDGLKNIPASRAKTLSAVERQVETEMIQHLTMVTKLANEKLVSYETTLLNTNLNNDMHDIKNVTDSYLSRLSSLRANEESHLKRMQGDLDRNRDNYSTFKRANDLQEDARYPESKILGYSFLFVFFLIESVANGYFFSFGSELGLLGGITQAMLVAFLNLFPAFLIIGMLVTRYVKHVKASYRWMSIIVVLLYAGWILVFNLLVAHYRDLLATLADEAMSLVIHKFIESPFSLNNIDSWLLFIFGIVFAVLAIIDGYKMDDPYPGYGRLHRRMEESQFDYNEEVERVIGEANSIRSEYQEKIQKLQQLVETEFAKLSHLVMDKPALVEQYKNCVNNLSRLGDAVIHRYRTRNESFRSTDTPAYFDSDVNFKIEHKLKDIQDDTEHLSEQKVLFNQFPRFVQKIGNKVEEEYANFINRIGTINGHPDAAVHERV